MPALHSTLLNKHILLGITGSIAAYKAAVLLRLLQEQGAQVRIIMTKGAMEFITPMTFQALSGHPVYTELLDEKAEAAMGHIQLARWADAIVIAPASADFIARFTKGRADDLLTAVCLASPASQLLAPAMNQHMWLNPATQDNINILKSRRNVSIIGPSRGDQACGDVGPGRMTEPELIVAEIETAFHNQSLLGKTMLITAGPTQEPIDPVRYLSNRSSGKMGYALAQAGMEAGANVILISGPTALPTPALNPEKTATRIDIRTAQQMYEAVMLHAANADIVIACAAVADYRPANASQQKIKKSNDILTIKLVRNPDIIADVARKYPQIFTVGFAAETEDLQNNAQAKLNAKGLNMIVANRVDDGSIGFESDDNAVIVYWPGGQQEFLRMRKTALARELLALIAEAATSSN